MACHPCGSRVGRRGGDGGGGAGVARAGPAPAGRPARGYHDFSPGDIIIRFAPYIGYVAGFLTVAAFLPQVVRTWRTRETRDLSLGMFALLITAGALWIIYGVLSGDWPVIATNLGMVALNCAIVVAIVRFRKA